MSLVKRVRGTNPRALMVGGSLLGMIVLALALVFLSANRSEQVVVVNAMAVSTGGGGTVDVSDDLYSQPAVIGREVDTVDYTQPAQTGSLDELWDQLTPEQQAIYGTEEVFLNRIYAWMEIAAQQPALIGGVPNQAAYDPQMGILGGDPSTDTQAGGSVPDWALAGLYVPDPTVPDPQIGGGAPVAQFDISTPSDVGGGTDGIYVPTSLVATCGGNGAPCNDGSVINHDTPPPVSTSYTVEDLDGNITVYDAAPQGN